jgi:HD-GYP domain-containing protein (c-di-GMP phosphodiesterase class II)
MAAKGRIRHQMVQLKKQVQVPVGALKLGMYVSRLDRPWLDTPYPIQGFWIRSFEDIERLKKHCRYVYVDTRKGSAPNTTPTGTSIRGPIGVETGLGNGGAARRPPTTAAASPKTKTRNDYEDLRERTYTDQRSFEEELPQAQKMYRDLDVNVREVVSQLSTGDTFDSESLRVSVRMMIKSLHQTPSAFLWVDRAKHTDPYTYRHLIGTSIWCGVLGRHIGLGQQELEDLALGGLLLDIGKAKLPRELLDKTTTLTDEEFDLIRTHVDASVRILAQDRKIPRSVMRIVATHHERWDGSGYPQGLARDQIPVLGRIAGLIDSFDAMTNPRPFQAALSPHQAIGQLYECRGTLFQAELVEQLIQACGIFPTGSLVELSNDEVAVVVGMSGSRRLRPKLVILLDAEKRPVPRLKTVDLATEHPEITVRKGLPPDAYGIEMQDLFLKTA